MKKLLLILMLVSVVSGGSDHTVGIGGTYATFALANTACSNNNNDTITMLSNDTIKSSIAIKSTVFIRSEATQCTLWLPATLGTYALSAGGNSIQFNNICLRYTNSSVTGTNYVFYSNGYGGHRFKKCVIDSGDGVSNINSKRGISFRKTAGTTTLKTTIDSCKFYGMTNNAIGASDTTLADSIEITNSVFNRCGWMFGHNYKFMYNKVGAFFGETGLFGSNLIYAYNYIDGDLFNGECLSAEQSGKSTAKLTNMQIHDNVWFDCSHVGILLDWMIDSHIYRNRFVGSTGTPFYHHNNGASMRSKNLLIYNNVLFSSSNSQAVTFAPKTDASNSDSIFFKKNILLNAGHITVDSVTNFYIDSCVWSIANPTLTITPASGSYQITYTDTAKGRGSILLDTTRYLFSKRGGVMDTIKAGLGSGFVENLSDSSAENAIYVKAKISEDFWYDDYQRGDSGKIILIISTNKTNWSNVDTSEIIYSGDTTLLSVTGLVSNTKYYYRVLSDSATTTLTDTTYIDSITTMSGGGETSDTAVITYRHIAAGSTEGGTRIDIVGSGFGSTTGSVFFGATTGTIVRWVDKKITVLSPAHSAGTVNMIVNPIVNVGDTTTFTFDEPTTPDTVFVDSMITDSTTTYNPLTRLSTGGSYKCYRWPQHAVNTITTGNNKSIVLRQGTYSGTNDYSSTFGYSTCFSVAQNGTSWASGHYNEFTNYNGERVTLDGRDSIKLVAAGTGSILGRAGYDGFKIKYWKIKGINFIRGKSADGLCAAGIWIEEGPFWVDSCTFNIGFIVSNSQIEAPAGIKGHGWRNCKVTNCYFVNSEGGINPYSDYNHVSIGANGFVEDNVRYSGMRNEYYNNLFDTIYSSAFKYKGGQLMSIRDGGFDTTYADCGDKFYNNIVKNSGYVLETGATRGIIEVLAGNQDFIQIYNNVVDSCYTGIQIQYSNLYPFIGANVYNNTIVNSQGIGIYRGATKYFADSVSESFVLNGSDFNNLIYNPVGFAYEIGRYSSVGFTYENYNIKNSYLYGPPSNMAIINNSEGNDIQYTFSNFVNLSFVSKVWSNSTSGAFRSEYIPDGSFVLNGDTTIQNGGVGGNYPSYIGAVDPTDTAWVPYVLSLSSLGTEEEPVANPPVITSQPHDSTVTDGSTVSFSVTATNATGYQWYGNGSLIPGATNSVYSFTAILALNNSKIYCIVYNATDTVWSDTATLTAVNALPKTPANITVEPVGDTVTAGQAATFFVTASGSDLTYQWYRNDSLIAGADNDTITYTARSQVGNYTDNIYCLLTTDTTISTDTVNLHVNGIVFRQSTDTLKLVCSNNQNVETWQWYKNNVSISGATDSVLSVVVDSTSAIKSVYYCEISNGVENKKVGDWTIERKANSRTVSRKNRYK